MKIEKIEFQNLGLVSGEFELNGKSVIVLASNGSGKTTFCEAFARICSSSMPADIVAKGAEEGSCKVELTDGTIIDWSKANGEKPVVTIISPEGKRKKNPAQKLLQEFTGSTYDLNADFLNKTPLEQKKLIASMCGLDLAAFDSDIKVAEENRTYIKRSAKEAEARTAGANSTLAKKDLLPVSDLNNKVAELAALKQRQESETQLLEGLDKRNKAIDEEFAAMQAKFDALKSEKSALITRIQKGKALLSGHKNIEADIEAAKEAVIAANEENSLIEAAKAKQRDVEIFTAKQTEVETAEEAVAKARNAKFDAVKAVELPAGLFLDDSGEKLMFTDKNGVSISVEGANEAQKTIIGLKLGLSQLGKVKALAVDMSHLDKANRVLVFDWANKNGLQLFAEKVSDDEGLTVEIVG